MYMYVINWVSISNEFWFFHIFDVWLYTGDIHVHVRCSNLPIGVLYDYHSKHVSLPWKLIIHFRKFPGNKVNLFYCFRISCVIIYSTFLLQLIRASTPSDTEKLFSHALKQSVFLLSGNTRLFTSLSIQKQNDLHQSVAAGIFLLVDLSVTFYIWNCGRSI